MPTTVNRQTVGLPARGPMYSARTRARLEGGTPAQPSGAGEGDLY